MQILTPFRIAFADPLLRVAFICILLMGPAVASINPFQSVIGIERLGLSNAAYAFIVTASALFSIIASVAVGIVTDQTGKYRGVLLICICVGICAGLWMWLVPTVASFVFVHLVLFPIATTTFTQYFALAAVAARRNPALDKDVGLSLVRAGFAGSYALAPPVWAFFLARGVDLFAVYAFLTVINVIVLGVVFFFWPSGAPADENDRSGLSFAASVRELSAPPVLSRLGLVMVITSANGLYGILLGLLIVNVLGGREADIGIFAGAVALVELPVMLAGALLVQRYGRTKVMFAGALIYGSGLGLLGLMPSMGAAWALILPFGIGAGIILAIPVGYIQDLVSHRPGAGSSLVSMSHFGGILTASAIFAVVAETMGYVAVALFGAAFAIAAAYVLLRMDRNAAPNVSS